MKTVALLAITLFTVTGFAQDSTEEAVVLNRIHEACEAYRTGDVEYIEDFLHEDYTLTNTRGVVTYREQDLKEARSGEPHYEEFRNHHMTVRIYGGDTAVVNGITSLKGTYGGEAFDLDVSFTDTLIKQGGMWKMVATHATRLEQ